VHALHEPGVPDAMITPVTSPAPAITLLGRVAIAAGDDSTGGAGRRGRRAELVFAYLAAEHHRVVTHDELADALWPDGLPGAWEAGLRGVLTEVRRFLAEGGLDPTDVLTTARRGHRLHLPPTVTVDLDEAREALAAARSHLAAGAAPAAAERAARAAALARLAFLPGHEGEWVEGVRRELATIAARALELEARAHADAGDLGAAATAAELLVRAEPFNEAAHQLRIRILGRAGDRSGAIRAYEHCRGVLAAELGVAPSDETEAAYRAATTADASAARPAPAPSPARTSIGTAGNGADGGTGGAGGLAACSVLVVEDHDFQRRTATMLLRTLGVGSVTEAEDGVAALRLLATSTLPDVILCDIDMPGMDGVEFIRHVAEGELTGAVIVASALDAKVLEAVRAVSEGYGLQVLGVIEKPLTARRLRDLLATYRPRPRVRSAPRSAVVDGAPAVRADAVRAAWTAGRIAFHLQPAVDVGTGLVAAAEVAPRWHEPDLGWVPASTLVPLLEHEGLLADVCARGVEVSSAQLREHERLGLDVAVSVDLAPVQLHDTDLADRTADVVRRNGADPAQLAFELDERAFRNAPGSALGVLTRLRVKGFGVSIDGFGAGRAPLDQLRRVPLTEVKVAPHLVAGAHADPQRTALLEETIEAGRALGVTVVGDGCESEHDLQLLLALGCDRVQGSFIAEAMDGEDLPAWVAAWDPDRLGAGWRG
jgi:EAL domain-containing protein (putative c-di-GMP-specific phosphodiesterase class I)/DNA-binding SARP family transcriptional activator/AmiR/NasT family two-component response regulator